MNSHVVGGCSTYSKVWMNPPHQDYPVRALYPESGVRLRCRMESGEEKVFLDFTAALGAVFVGYEGVTEYISGAPSYPLPHESEEEAAALLCEATGFGLVRWCKNGGDAVEGAVRIARHVTKRGHIITNSYHGAHSDLIGATSGKSHGVSSGLSWLVHPVRTPGALIERLLRDNDETAAVVMEPLTPACQDWHLAEVRHLCDKRGVVLIFDEVITGFRCRWGSAAPHVRPDLACYGKALANGWPLAALTGRGDLMCLLEREVFMSATAAAEIISLQTCRENLVKLRGLDYRAVEERGARLGLALTGTVQGYPQRWQLVLEPVQHREFAVALARRGILVGHDFFIMAVHTDDDIDQAVQVIGEARAECSL